MRQTGQSLVPEGSNESLWPRAQAIGSHTALSANSQYSAAMMLLATLPASSSCGAARGCSVCVKLLLPLQQKSESAVR